MRHGEASFRAKSDFARELTPHGKRQVAKTASLVKRYVESKNIPRDTVFIWASPLIRAQQTAHILADTLHSQVTTKDFITPNDDPQLTLERLYKEAGDISFLILITHMPLCAAMASLLTTEGCRMQAGFDTAECQRFICSDYLPACAEFGGIVE